MEEEIWQVTDKDARELLEADAPGVTDEEIKAILRRLPLYFDAALRECLAELARQEMDRRQSSDTRHPSGLESAK